MKTIALAAAKGGVGKTTLTAGLAVAAGIARPDQAVGLIDLDPQGSLTRWWNDRAAGSPVLYELAGRSIRAAKLQLASDGISTLFLDCPPSFSIVLEGAISAADLVIIPVQASLLDLTAVESTMAMAHRLGVPYRLILNRAIFRSRLAGWAVSLLRQEGCFTEPTIHQRVAIPDAMTGGQTAIETEPGGRAAAEITALWRAIAQALGTTNAPRSRAAHDMRAGA